MNVSRRSLLAAAFAALMVSACSSQNGAPGLVPQAAPMSARAASPLAGLVVIPDYNYATVSYYAPKTGKLLYKLVGASTKLSYPGAVAVDKNRNTYVLGHFNTKTNKQAYEILVFDAQAPLAAHPAPTRVIVGAHTGLSYGNIAVDTTGAIYVTRTTPDNAVLVFAPGAHGNVAPVRTISGNTTQLVQTQGIAIARDRTIRVGAYGGVLTFAAAANGDVAPIHTLAPPSGAKAAGIAIDAHGNIVVADYNGAVYGYAASATGNATPLWTLRGGRTKLAEVYSAVADKTDNVYASIVNASVSQVGIYPPGGGNAAPLKRITFSFPVFQMAVMP